MSSLPTPPRLNRVPLPLPPRSAEERKGDDEAGLQPSDVIDGRYQIEAQIGEGGVGIVYRAMQLKLHRRVAIKLLQQDVAADLEQRPRFEREAVTLAALSHPNIVSVQDYGVFRSKPFLVMELLEGRTLREVLDQEGPLAPARAFAIVKQVLHALIYAHSLGIVHRDLKPANLVIQTLPSHEHLKVLDFGMVKLMPGSYLDRGVQLSRVGFAFGTPAYMSPEHATGGPVDGRTDVYSTGVLLFELLTGKKPFEGELHEVIRHHLSSPVPKLWEKHPALAGQEALQAVIERSVAKLQNDRYPSALELLNALDALEKLAPAGLAGGLGEAARVTLRPGDSPFEQAGARVDQALRAVLARCRGHWKPELLRMLRNGQDNAQRIGGKALERTERAWGELKPRLQQGLQRVQVSAAQLKERALNRPGVTQRLSSPAPAPSPQLAEAATVILDDADLNSPVNEADPAAESSNRSGPTGAGGSAVETPQ